MDPLQKSSQQKNPQNNTSQIQDELTHVNQEMYKKNLELAEKNKILSLLRKIDSIILSTLTDIKQIVQQVTNVVVDEAAFIRVVTVFMLDKDSNSLDELAISQTEAVKKAELELNKTLQGLKIPIETGDNLVSNVIKKRKMLLTHELHDIFSPYLTKEESDQLQKIVQGDTSYIYPLIVRGGVIGAMVLSVQEIERSLPYYKLDLIDRIPGIIAIAIDNALLYQNIQEANERLKEVDKQKDEFVSLASHELRTPMTVIKSYIWTLLNGNMGELSEKQRKYLETTFSSTEELLKLVNNMLNVSRIESGRFTIELVPTDICKLVSDVTSEMQARAREVKINLSCNAPQSPLTAKADTEKIKEVLINLIGNSIKFTPEYGSVIVSIEKDGENFALIKVADTGAGIRSEDMPKLFQKFNMVGNTHLTKDKGQGSGLGLYLSKSLVELHGGKIWAKSEGEGKGSTFLFTLPIVSASSSQYVNPVTADLTGAAASPQTDKHLLPEPNPQV